MKSVAIIGAGPSGLVTAKTLLHCADRQLFDVTVLEKGSRVGGLWAVFKGDQSGRVDPEMPTNTSRFATCFSDFAWTSVDLGEKDASVFPEAWKAGRYLEAYAERYLPKGTVRLDSRVVSAEQLDQDGVKGWKIKWHHNTGHECQSSNGVSEAVFDYLVVAGGFNAAPRSFDVKVHADASALSHQLPKIVHSSNYRQFADIAPEGDWDGTGNFLVVGGSISGVEKAGLLALDLSSALHTPSARTSSKEQNEAIALKAQCKVIHVTARPLYVLSSVIKAPSPDTCVFAPADVVGFELSYRPLELLQPTRLEGAPVGVSRMKHMIFKSLAGDASNLGAPALVPTDLDQAVYFGNSEYYRAFVRSKDLSPVQGRVKSLEIQCSNGKLSKHRHFTPFTAVIRSPDGTQQIENVVGVLAANGYEPWRPLDFLSDEVKNILELDKDARRLPVLLDERMQTGNSAIRSLGFVGVFEGIFWGLAEMQARLIAQRWVKELEPSHSTAVREKFVDLDHLRDFRLSLGKRDLAIDQTQGDYVADMETAPHS